MPSSRCVSLAQYALLPLAFDTNAGDQTTCDGSTHCSDQTTSTTAFGTLRPGSLFSADVDGDGAEELLVGGSGGCLAVFKHLQDAAPWATSAPVLGTIVTVCGGHLTIPRGPSTLSPALSPSSTVAAPGFQIIVVSAEGECHLFDLQGCRGGFGSLRPTATYRVAPSVTAAAVVNTGKKYDHLYVATTDKALHAYGLIPIEMKEKAEEQEEEEEEEEEKKIWTECQQFSVSSEGGYIESLSVFEENGAQSLAAGLQSGKIMLLMPLEKRVQVLKSSLPKRRTDRIDTRRRRQQLRYERFYKIGMAGMTDVQAEHELMQNASIYDDEVAHGIDEEYIEGDDIEEEEEEGEDEEAGEDIGAMSMMMKMQAEVEQRLQTQMRIQVSSGGALTSGGEMAAMGFRGALGGPMPAARNYKSTCERPMSRAAANVACAAAQAAEASDMDASQAAGSRPPEARRRQHESDSLSLLDSTVVLGGVAGWGRSTIGALRHPHPPAYRPDPSLDDGPVIVAATLDGDLSVRDASTGDILWYDSLGSKRGQVFSLQALDVTGDGVDELIACSWDGRTCIFDRALNCTIHDFEDRVVAFRACHLSISSIGDARVEGSVGTFSGQQPCLVYATNSSISVFVMGTTTACSEGAEGSLDRPLHSSLSLELHDEVARLAGRTDVSAGRPVKYVRPPSLSDVLSRRSPDLVDSILRIARESLGRSEGITFAVAVKHLLKCRRALHKD